MEPGEIDHVQEGLSRIPEKLRADRIDRYLSIYLQQFDSLEDAVLFLVQAFLNWRTFGNQRDFVLEIIGSWLDQPRPSGFDNDQYAFILQARVLVRRSSATLADVYRVANYLAQDRDVRVFGFVPRTIHVVFFDLVIDAELQALYQQLLLDTVGDVDGLSVFYTTSAAAQYDIDAYDGEGLYT